MRILYFHQHFSTPRGSTGTRSYEMARHLTKHGHQVTMICGSYKGSVTGLDGPFTKGRRQGEVDGIEVIEYDLAYSNADGFLRRCLTFLKFMLKSTFLAVTMPADLVFATTTPLTVAIPGIAARWLRGRKFVFEVRDLWPELPKAMGVITNPLILGLMSALEWAAYHSAHRLVALSPGIKEGIVRRGISEGRIALIPNGCDLDIFSGATPWRPEKIPASALLAIFAGTHGIANGLNAVLNAAEELKTRGCSDIIILLIGSGRLKSQLEARTVAQGLDNVVFHAPVGKHRLAGLMASADLSLQTLANVPAFYYGTSPNKFFDSIAAGKPVLNNYPGWLADMIGAHACGYTVPPDDPKAFADALEHAASHRAELKAMGERAKALARSEFDRAVLANHLAVWLEAAAASG